MRGASRQAQKLCPEDPVGYSCILQGEWGSEKPASSFLGVAAPPLYPVRCVFKPAEGWSTNSFVLGRNLNAGLIPSPTQQPEAILTLPQFKQACLVLMAFLRNLFTINLYHCSDLPISAKFPSLSVVLYWDF